MIFSMIKTELKKQLTDKGFFFWLLGMPILFIVLFSFIFGAVDEVTFTVHYINEDATEMSEQFLMIIEEAEVFDLIEKSSEQAAIEELEGGNISTLIIIPEGFENRLYEGKQNAIDFHFDSLKQDSVRPVQNLVENIAYSFQQEKVEQILRERVSNEEELTALLEPPFSINEVAQQSEEQNAITQIVPGYTVMFTFFIIISMVNSFLKDREGGMLARLASTPLNKYQYLLGKWVPFIIIVFVQVWVLLGFGYLVYDLYLGNLFAIFILSIVLSLTTTGLGLAIALFAKSENFGIAITQVLALGGAMLGGLWVPIEFLPELMQRIALFVPQYWAQAGFQDIMLRGAGVTDIGASIAVLLIVAIIGLLFAAKHFNKFLNGAKS
ncbi:ABC transporter permease [Bacillus shivajii]|uniref:ABC transporter permease n=1 Tax=Bacillus shivajii TaxID=1983719 RepID=UPI001CFBCA26|nr:ABC transporter permease [Bacillus shivajii]UCZ54657.1 ABC transporter permease [Bacillus shivajii]